MLALILIIAGVILIIISGILTNSKIKDNPVSKNLSPEEVDRYVPQTDIVPKWVSAINILGWVLLVIGVLTLFL